MTEFELSIIGRGVDTMLDADDRFGIFLDIRN